MLRTLSCKKLNREVKETKVWEGDDFSVKSAYECITNDVKGSSNATFKYLWMSKALPSVLTTTWRALLDRLPTRVNLNRRDVVVNNLFVFCVKIGQNRLNTYFWNVRLHIRYGTTISNGLDFCSSNIRSWNATLRVSIWYM